MLIETQSSIELDSYQVGIIVKKKYYNRSCILRRLLRKSIRNTALEDFEERFEFIRKNRGRFVAILWYWFQIISLIQPFIHDSISWRVAMFTTYLKIAIRNIKKQKVYSFINITGLAIGMACCFLILLWVQDELSYDRFHEKANRIFRVYGRGLINTYEINQAYSPAPMARTLLAEFPEVTQSGRIFNPGQLNIQYGNKKFTEDTFLFADASILDIFTFPLIRGDMASALIQPNSVVVTQATALKYFGNDDPVGKTITLNNTNDFTITGVMEDIPHNSHFHFHFLGSLISLDFSRSPLWITNTYYTYVLLSEGHSSDHVERQFPALVVKYMGPQILQDLGMTYDQFIASGNHYGFHLQPITDIHLHSSLDFELEANSEITYVTMFSAIAVFILMIACFNYMNLATARSAGRAMEVGVRKVLGSNRVQLAKQFLGESVLYSFIALFIAAVLVQLVIPYFRNLTGKPFDLRNISTGTVMFGFVSIAILVGIVAGSYPASFLAGFKPVTVFKGRSRCGQKNKWLRNCLVVFQFCITIFLFISTFVVYRQLVFIQNRKLGFNKEQILLIRGGQILGNRYDVFKEEILKHPHVSHATSSNTIPGKRFGSSGYRREDVSDVEMHLMIDVNADEDFINTYDMGLLKGRYFSRERSADEFSSIVINEVASKTFGFEDPIGKMIFQTNPDPSGEDSPFVIIGVVKDFHFESLHQAIRPLNIRLTSTAQRYISIRIVPEDIHETIHHIQSKWQQFVPGQPFDYTFFDSEYDNLYTAEQRTGKIFTLFSIFAIFIACLGLLGLVSYTAEQRTKEIGIRKTLGASVSSIIWHLTKEYLKWILLSNIIAWPVAYIYSHKWLQNFSYRTDISVRTFILSTVLTLIIALMTVSNQSIKAASTNPIDSLRYE